MADTPVRKHWLVQDGEPASALDLAEKDRLARVCEAIAVYDSKQGIYYDALAWSAAVEKLLEHGGYRVIGGSTAFQHFSFSPKLLCEATRGSSRYPQGFVFPDPTDWKRSISISENIATRRKYAELNPGTEVLDLLKLFWQAGTKVGERMGFRLALKMPQGGPDPLERVMSWMGEAEGRLSA
jgi:hypothetical protein